MTDDVGLADEPDDGNEEEIGIRREDVADGGPTLSGSVPSLDAFASIQRSLASIDFSATQAAQRALTGIGPLKRIVETQEAIASHFARSLDFSRIARTLNAFAQTAATAHAKTVQKQWADPRQVGRLHGTEPSRRIERHARCMGQGQQ